MAETHAYPATPGELTRGWLTGALRASGALAPGASVLRFTATPMGAGSGFMGALVRLAIDYDDAGDAPRSLVAKFAGAPGHHRDMAMQFKLYEREVRFYQEVAPALADVAPRCHIAEIDPATGDSVLLLEDLGDYRTGDQAEGCSAEQARMVIDILASLHARNWGQIDRFGWAPRIDGDVQIGGAAAGCAYGWDALADRFGHRIDKAILDRRDAYLAAIPAMHRRMATPVQTLVHGDVRLDNLMFGVRESHRPAVALDWIVTYSAGVQDLAYLLTQNLRVEERRAHQADLVVYYHQRLKEAGILDYSLDHLWQDYRFATLFLFSYAVLIAGALDPTNERGARMMEQLTHRAASAVTDQDLLGLLDDLPSIG